MKWVEVFPSSYKRFSLFSLAFVVVVVVVALRFSGKRDILNFRVMVVRDIELRKFVIFSPFRSQSIGKSAYENACLLSTDNQSPR